MSDTVIAPDLKFDYEWAKDNADRRKFYGSEIVKLIERCSKAEQENVALRAENERLTKIMEDSRMDLKGFDEETLAWFAAGGQKGE